VYAISLKGIYIGLLIVLTIIVIGVVDVTHKNSTAEQSRADHRKENKWRGNALFKKLSSRK